MMRSGVDHPDAKLRLRARFPRLIRPVYAEPEFFRQGLKVGAAVVVATTLVSLTGLASPSPDFFEHSAFSGRRFRRHRAPRLDLRFAGDGDTRPGSR